MFCCLYLPFAIQVSLCFCVDSCCANVTEVSVCILFAVQVALCCVCLYLLFAVQMALWCMFVLLFALQKSLWCKFVLTVYHTSASVCLC